MVLNAMEQKVMEQKANVYNPIKMFNTVGQEVESIFIVMNKDAADFMPIDKLRARTKFSEKEISRLCKMLNVGEDHAKFVRNFQENYEASKKKAAVSFKESKKAFTKLKGILPLLGNEYTQGRDVLNDILDYFDVDSEQEIFTASENFASLFRRKYTIEINPINLYAWLRRGELDFYSMDLPQYNEKALENWIQSGEWRLHIEDTNYFQTLPSVLGSFGVALVLVPYLPKTVNCCVRWFNGQPLIQISDRNRDLAACWFTLFHELGHVLLHPNEEIFESQLNRSRTNLTSIEREANEFANSYLCIGDN